MGLFRFFPDDPVESPYYQESFPVSGASERMMRRFGAGSRGWETTFKDERLAHGHHAWLINCEHSDRRPSDRRKANEDRRSPGEMLTPLVAAGMVESRKFLSHRVDAGEIWPLMEIAVNAAKRAVRKVIAPAMLLGNDMVHLVP
jgi:hypothetical protein